MEDFKKLRRSSSPSYNAEEANALAAISNMINGAVISTRFYFDQVETSSSSG